MNQGTQTMCHPLQEWLRHLHQPLENNRNNMENNQTNQRELPTKSTLPPPPQPTGR